MKKLLLVSMMIAGLFATIGTASALETMKGAPTWVTDAMAEDV